MSQPHPSSSATTPPRLQGYPADVQEAFRRFRSSRDPADLDAFVLGSLDFLLQRPAGEPLRDTPDDTRLREDLGADSLAITEIVFLMEELFDIEIANAELTDIETLGDLRAFCRSRVEGGAAS